MLQHHSLPGSRTPDLHMSAVGVRARVHLPAYFPCRENPEVAHDDCLAADSVDFLLPPPPPPVSFSLLHNHCKLH